jgi:hypothetical protein
MNMRRAPSRVFSNQAEDQFAQFSADAPPSHVRSTPRNPGPIQTEAFPMPTNHGFWLDQDQCTLPSGPQSAQHNPEELIWGRPLRSPMPHLRTPSVVEEPGFPRASRGDNERLGQLGL